MLDYRSMFDLTGKKALVVGAGSGMGEAGAHGLAAFGARVFCADVNAGAVEDTAEQIRSEGGKGEALELDMTDSGSVRAAAADVGVPDVLVSTPSINVRKPLLDHRRGVRPGRRSEPQRYFSPDPGVRTRDGRARLGEHHRLLELPGAGRRAGAGSIRSDQVGDRADAARSGRRAGPQGVRVNTIAPGAVETPLTAQMKESPDWYDAYAQKNILGRWAKPHEIVGMIVYLASDASSYVTGAFMLVDGGWTAADGRFTPPL